MARSVSDEELQLKKRARRRLIGAVVLVTTVAVVLPMVLDSEPRPANPSISIQIPAQDAGIIAKPPAPLKPSDPAGATQPPAPKTEEKSDALAAAKPEAQAVTKPEAKPEAKAKAETKAETKAEAKTKPEPVAKTEAPPLPPPESKAAAESAAKTAAPAAEARPADSKAAAPSAAKAESKPAKPEAAKPDPAKSKDADKAKPAGGYVIQVAALADAAKARELQAKLAGAGLKAYTEQVQTAKGPVTRVRVGPYASREAAEKVRPQLQKLQLDGKVVPR